MGTFLWFKCCAKSFNSTPVSIPTRIKVLEFDCLMRGDFTILFTRGEALVPSCWLYSFFNVYLWFVGVCSGLYLGSLVLWQWLGCCCCCRQKELLEQTVPSQDKWLMTKGEIVFMSNNPFLRRKEFSSLLPSCSFSKQSVNFVSVL